MVQAILVRHAEKIGDGKDAPITPSGRAQTCQLGKFLASLNLRPQVILSSTWRHARDTAEGIADVFKNGPPQVLPIDTLTPEPKVAAPTFPIEQLLATEPVGILDLADNATVIVVGHEPRLTQLITMMTTKRLPPLERLEAVCIEANTVNDLRVGRGVLKWRWLSSRPIADASGNELGPKLNSKMTVAALLVGFNFTALLELVKEPEKLRLDHLPALVAPGTSWTEEQTIFALLSFVAILCLTISLGLFVLAIYIYDRLGMPQGYLEAEPFASPLGRWSKRMRGRTDRFGFVYAAMIHAWVWVFTPAVVFAVIGFLCIVSRGQIPLAVGVLVVIVSVLAYHRLARPGYSVD